MIPRLRPELWPCSEAVRRWFSLTEFWYLRCQRNAVVLCRPFSVCPRPLSILCCCLPCSVPERLTSSGSSFHGPLPPAFSWLGAVKGPAGDGWGHQKGERRSSPLFWLLWLPIPAAPSLSAVVSSPGPYLPLWSKFSPCFCRPRSILRLPIPAVAISEKFNDPCQFPFKKIVNYIGRSILHQGQVYSMVIRHVKCLPTWHHM